MLKGGGRLLCKGRWRIFDSSRKNAAIRTPDELTIDDVDNERGRCLRSPPIWIFWRASRDGKRARIGPNAFD